MVGKPAVKIIAAKCCISGKTFAIRAEQTKRDWIRTWAFPIEESKAKREGYSKSKITGTFTASPEYPGCPHCSAEEIMVCSCGKVSCFSDGYKSITCGWCGTKINDIIYDETLDVRSGTM